MSRGLWWKLLLALSLGANAALGWAVVRGREAGGAPPAGEEGSTECVLASLELDAVQRPAVERIRAGFVAFRDQQRTRLAALRGELFAAVSAASPDSAVIDGLIGGIAEAQEGLRRRLVDQVLGILALLRPEQRAKFLEGIRERFLHGGHGGGPVHEAGTCGAGGGGAG